jgi:hypothetical protein
MPSPVIQFKRGLFANLPGLQAGEPGFTTDKYDLYIGLTSETSTNKFFGSHRYWSKETTSTGSGVNLVEGSVNGTSFITLASPASLVGIVTYYFPGTQGTTSTVLTNDGNGNLSWSSGSLNPVFTGISTFMGLVDANGGATIDNIQIGIVNDNTIDTSTGNLTIDSAGGTITVNDQLVVTGISTFNGNVDVDQSLNVDGNVNVTGISTFTGITTVTGPTLFTTQFSSSGVSSFKNSTDNTLGNADTGAVQIDGGVGINKNVTIGQNLYVGGYSEFVGVVTFKGGTISLGDEDTDSITIGAEFASDLIPNADAGYNLGNFNKRWKNAIFSGIVTSNTFVGEVNSPTFDTNQSGVVVTGIVTATTGNITGNLTVGGNLFVNGSTTQVNTQTLTVEDALIEVGLVNGSAPSTDLDLDLGLLLNYFDGSAKKAAVYWDDSASRIVLASQVSESSGVLAASGYAGLEIGSLYVNDCAGQTQVISCTGSTRNLINITIDAGSF